MHLLAGGSDEALRIELEGIRVDCRVVEDAPSKKVSIVLHGSSWKNEALTRD